MKDFISQGMQQKIHKSCSECNKNIWPIESNYILQPPKYSLLIVNRFRYTINNVTTKDRCSIPMDTTVMLGPLKFCLRATIDHHGLSIHSVIILHLSIVAKSSIAKTTKLRSLKLLIAKLLYCICYSLWIDWLMSFGPEQEGGGLITPMALAHPLHPINSRSRNKRRNMWVGRCVSYWWHLFPSRNSVLIYIHSLWVLVIGCIYTYTGSVVQYWWSCTPSQSIGVRGSCVWMPLVAFFGFTNCVLLCDK